MSARGVDPANFDLKKGIIFALNCIITIAIASVFAMKTWSLPKVTLSQQARPSPSLVLPVAGS